jgi:rubrerythrin
MKRIKHLVEDIREELEGAEHYAKLAMKMKDEAPSDASLYAEMSRQEMEHVNKLHTMAVRLIEKQRQSGVTPPAAMQAVWDWEHEKMIEHLARIKHMLSMV